MVSTGDSDLTRLHERRYLCTITDDSKLSSGRTSTNTGKTLILKTATADEKKRKKKRCEALAKIQSEQGVPASISRGSGSKSIGGNTLLNGLFSKEEVKNTLLHSVSLDDYSQKMDRRWVEKENASEVKKIWIDMVKKRMAE